MKRFKNEDSQEVPLTPRELPKSATDSRLLKEIRNYLLIIMWGSILTGVVVVGIFVRMVIGG